MQSIIASLASRHGLSRAEVLLEVESAFSALLSRWYRREVQVHFQQDLGLEAVAYARVNGIVHQRVIDLPAMLGRARLSDFLEQHLETAGVCNQVRRYKPCEHNLLWGEIVGSDPVGNLRVAAEILPGEPVLALCPLNRIGVHERHTVGFQVGQRRAFHLRRVEAMERNGIARVQVVLDRVAKTLVETLLHEQLGAQAERIRCHCLKRYVGHRSLVVTDQRLPKAAILSVDRELRERVEVRILRQP